jgi:hypothetical protein
MAAEQRLLCVLLRFLRLGKCTRDSSAADQVAVFPCEGPAAC